MAERSRAPWAYDVWKWVMFIFLASVRSIIGKAIFSLWSRDLTIFIFARERGRERGWGCQCDQLCVKELFEKSIFQGNIKLNTDGSWYEADRKAAFGGIFRNDKGEWILGFHGKMEADSSLATEIWAIYRGLTDHHIEERHDQCEIGNGCSSGCPVKMISEDNNENQPQIRQHHQRCKNSH